MAETEVRVSENVLREIHELRSHLSRYRPVRAMARELLAARAVVAAARALTECQGKNCGADDETGMPMICGWHEERIRPALAVYDAAATKEPQ